MRGKNLLGNTTLPTARPGRKNNTSAYRPDIDGLRAVSISAGDRISRSAVAGPGRIYRS
jgi:hypothetical protein